MAYAIVFIKVFGFIACLYIAVRVSEKGKQ